jgi:hypothetical protein
MISNHNEASNRPSEEEAPLPETKITCDYLVVGAGTACLSFVDTLLTRRKDVTFIIVDRNSAPGGHWTTAYPFVRLHQPSCNYGVNSLPLSYLDKNGNEPWDQNVRASAKEICEYYKKVVQNFEATGRVRTYFDTNYEGEAKNVDNNSSNSNNYNDPTAQITHTIATKNGRIIHIDCTKVVRCESNVQVPSMREGLPFPIDKSVVKSIPLNDLPSNVGEQSSHEKYLIIGGGKSGVDAIVYLIKKGKVRYDQITWIVPRPYWYLVRDRIHTTPKPGSGFWKDAVLLLFTPLLEANSALEVFVNMEKLGVAQRVDLDDEQFPSIFKGATLDQFEIDELRKIPNTNVVKNKGRVTSITAKEVVFANGEHSIPFSPTNTLVVDCTVDNLYDYLAFKEDFKFFNPHKIRIGPLTSFLNPSHTSAQIGFLEAEYSDTASGDEVKNSYMYFCRGSELNSNCQYLPLNYYAHLKTDIEFDKCPNYRRFALASRTDRQQPNHHGGILGLLWAVFGPLKLHKNALDFVAKMENKGYKDFPNPLPGRTGADPSKIKVNMRNPPKAKKSKGSKCISIKSIWGKISLKKYRGTNPRGLPIKNPSGSTDIDVPI